MEEDETRKFFISSKLQAKLVILVLPSTFYVFCQTLPISREDLDRQTEGDYLFISGLGIQINSLLLTTRRPFLFFPIFLSLFFVSNFRYSKKQHDGSATRGGGVEMQLLAAPPKMSRF